MGVQVSNRQIGREGWKTVRMAMTSWAHTARLVTIILAVAVPSLLTAFLVRQWF